MQAVLFDKDGTLFDFRKSWAAWAAGVLDELASGDLALRARLEARMGFDREAGRFDPDSVAIAGTPDDAARVLAPELSGRSARDLGAWLAARAAEARMVPAVELAPLLKRLAGAGLTLGVATNDAAAAATAHLADAGIAEAFAHVYGYDSGFGPKPGAGMCRAFSEATGLDPATIVMVGDSTHDLIAGRAAGMATVAVLTGTAERATLAPLADAVLPDIGHLPGWLEI